MLVVIGVEPESLEIGFEPSAPVQRGITRGKRAGIYVFYENGAYTAEPNT